MTREERDRIIVLEQEFKHLDGKVDGIGVKVDALDTKVDAMHIALNTKVDSVITAINNRSAFEKGAKWVIGVSAGVIGFVLASTKNLTALWPWGHS